MTDKRFDTLLLTGAAGRLGTVLRRELAPLAHRLRVLDRKEIPDLQPNEEAVICDLGDEAAVIEATRGVDAIVHFGGAPLEVSWNEILNSSIRGSYNIYEGARRNGVRRVVYSSSVHAIGYHTLEDRIDGVVITFANITAAKTLEAQLRAKQAGLEKQVEARQRN